MTRTKFLPNPSCCNPEAILEWLQQQSPASEIVGSGFSACIRAWKDSTVVLKAANSPSSAPKLQQEEELLRQAAAWSQDTLIHVPRSYGFFISNSCCSNLGIPKNHPFIAMERLQPLSPQIELSLQKINHPQHWEQKPRRLWRLYLGLDQTPAAQSFFAGDYPLVAGRTDELDLPLSSIARDMGRFIARMTYSGGWNAKDVEFVVAGKDMKIFCLDFGEMQKHSGEVNEIVAGLHSNEPYYPQRQDRHRDDFGDGYVQEAKLAGKEELAQEVLQKLYDSWYLDRCR